MKTFNIRFIVVANTDVKCHFELNLTSVSYKLGCSKCTHPHCCIFHCLRPVPEAGRRDSSLCKALHHGCEAGPAQLRPICVAGETGTTDKEIPTDGGDWLPGPWHEGELDRNLCNDFRSLDQVIFCLDQENGL